MLSGKCCKGGKMVLKPSCGWCKDQDEFVVNPQLVILINCFKKICELIHNSPILEHIKEFDKHCQGKLKFKTKLIYICFSYSLNCFIKLLYMFLKKATMFYFNF